MHADVITQNETFNYISNFATKRFRSKVVDHPVFSQRASSSVSAFDVTVVNDVDVVVEVDVVILG